MWSPPLPLFVRPGQQSILYKGQFFGFVLRDLLSVNLGNTTGGGAEAILTGAEAFVSKGQNKRMILLTPPCRRCG